MVVAGGLLGGLTLQPMHIAGAQAQGCGDKQGQQQRELNACTRDAAQLSLLGLQHGGATADACCPQDAGICQKSSLHAGNRGCAHSCNTLKLQRWCSTLSCSLMRLPRSGIRPLPAPRRELDVVQRVTRRDLWRR
eukprot:SAG11_NODE_7205_length_1178_cov_1.382762_1_plen_134_part_10